MPRQFAFSAITPLEQPFLLLATVFICGMLSGSHWLTCHVWLSIILALWFLAGLALLFNRHSAMPILVAGFFVMGGTLVALDDASVGPDRIRSQIERGQPREDEPVLLEAKIARAPELAPDRLLLEVDATAVVLSRVRRRATGRVQLVISFNDEDDRRDYDALQLDYATRLRVLCHLRRPPGYQNPGTTSFQALLDQRGLDAVAAIKSPLLIEVLGTGRGSGFLRLLYSLRSAAIRSLLRTLSQPTSGLLVAAILGNHNFLDRRVAETFRSGGTYHLLVISGLHIALLASSLLFLTNLMVRRRSTRILLIISALWAFSIMVGAQPAVTRAAAMLSIALFGEIIFRRQVGANTLGAVALTLLAWEPRDLFNPGFQLSFLTVLAIVLGTGPLYERLRRIGQWKPSETTPHPPSCPRTIRRFAELVFWDAAAFRNQIEDSRIRYRLDKAKGLRLPPMLHATWIARAVFATLLTTIGIQSALLPLMILYFHRVSIIAPMTNVIEALLIFLLMISGCLYLLVLAVDERIAAPLARCLTELGRIAVEVSHFFDDVPHAAVRVPDFGERSVLVYGLYLLVVLCLVRILWRWNPLQLTTAVARQGFRRIGARVVSAAMIAAWVVFMWLLVAYPFEHRFVRGRLSVTVLDVGQGDSIAINFPRGTIMLLDAGGKLAFDRSGEGDTSTPFIEDRAGIGELAIAPFLWRQGVKRIDLIAATHSDADHVQGFDDIVPSFTIGRALSGPQLENEEAHRPFPFAITRKSIPRKTLSRGDAFEIDDVRVEVLAPFPEMRSPRFSPNDRSLVLRLVYGERRFLLTGDIESRTEALLVASSDDLRADVLKVAHHGSRTSSGREFLSRVAPQFALISAGSPSPFGHPHDEVISRLREMGAEILRTGSCGAMTFSTDGHDLTHQTFVKCR
ncbi:MAG: ComEC/Rec2 family competence protein [Acidobacteriota bacterium]